MDPQSAGPHVLEALKCACSQDTNILKPAEQQLKSWETEPGFYSILQSVYLDHSIDTNIRWLAVVYFKNGIDRYWRKTAPNAIQEEEKTALRQKMIGNFLEPVPQIATQLAVLIAKVARVDCPRNWPELIPTLLEAVKQENNLICLRALLTLHHVIKMLASKRLSSDRKLFEELTSNIFGFVLNLWNTHLTHFFQLVQTGSKDNMAAMMKCIEFATISLKVLRKLYVYGFREPREVEETITLLTLVLEKMSLFLEAKNSMTAINDGLLESREKYLILLSKVLLDAQMNQPLSFIPFIRPSLELLIRYNFTPAGEGCLFERFSVNSLVLIKDILRSDHYRPAKTIEETKNRDTIEAYKVKMDVFSAGTLAEMVRVLIGKYFLYTVDDLTQWEESPEEFVSDESGDSWKYSLRPCTEVLFLTMFKEFKEMLTPVVMQLVKESQAPIDPNDLNALLKKDAVYNAVGLASYELYDEVDFDQWFKSSLIPDLQSTGRMVKLVKRRVVWLIGQWVSVKLSPSLRPLLYENLLPLLKAEEDLVVRIEAANTLKSSVDDFEFKVEVFMPYLDTSFGLLFQLLKEVVECESKMQVLHVMSFLIERAEREIKPFAGSLLQYLPLLWRASEEHNMLRCAILSTLIHLVEGLGTLSVNAHDFLLPVIQLSTDVTQEPHVYLLEDGLDLWRTTLHHSPMITPGLLELYKNMPELLELGTENLRTCLKIIESYLYLSPKEFLGAYSASLLESLRSLTTDIRPEGLVMVMKIVELVFRLFPVEGAQIFQSLLPSVLQNILEKEEYPILMAVYLSITARILLQNAEFFWQFIEQFSQSHNVDSYTTLSSLFDTWLDRVDNIIQPERRKLTGLALASIITLDLNVVLEKFGAIMAILVEILHDVCRLQDEGNCIQIDCLVMRDDDEEPEMDSEHERRKHLAARQDPVHCVSLKDYVASQLNTCQQMHGQESFQRLMSYVDSEVAHQLKFLLR
ncbi:importin-11-like [Lineus longissimus]|uniref:importin-11-like n=1 Tax=Lineus longissimus TaxID=88925 RepID=UPI002B4C4F8B